jgi:hypothetical protein
MLTLLIFVMVFLAGELLVNKTAFRYIKSYFQVDDTEQKPFIGMNISTFKGMLERFIIFLALSLSVSQILIVFGTIKIGTRLDNKQKIKNDYFLIGNFCTVLFSLIYYYLFLRVMKIIG